MDKRHYSCLFSVVKYNWIQNQMCVTNILTCSFDVRCPIAGANTVDGHHRDSVECVTDQTSEGVGVHW